MGNTNNAGIRVCDLQLEKEGNGGARNASSGSKEHHHVVHIEEQPAAAGCCVVCREPWEWVTVGPCGHRAMCAKCMVRARYVDGDMSCRVCEAHCSAVLVTRAQQQQQQGAASSSCRGVYWYHAKTAAYFDDLRQYQVAKKACRSAFYQPLHVFVTLLVASIIVGAAAGSSGAEGTKHMALKVLAYALGIFVMLLIFGFIWFTLKYAPDPLTDEDARGGSRSTLETLLQ